MDILMFRDTGMVGLQNHVKKLPKLQKKVSVLPVIVRMIQFILTRVDRCILHGVS